VRWSAEHGQELRVDLFAVRRAQLFDRVRNAQQHCPLHAVADPSVETVAHDYSIVRGQGRAVHRLTRAPAAVVAGFCCSGNSTLPANSRSDWPKASTSWPSIVKANTTCRPSWLAM